MTTGVIYCAISPSNKKYYGYTIDFMKRKKEHLKGANSNKSNYFYHAIRKYGFDNFQWNIIETYQAEDKEQLHDILCQREKYWILTDKTNISTFGYNATIGGDGILGYKFTPEQYKKVCEKNRIINEAKRLPKKQKGPHGMTGKHHTEESRHKISLNNAKTMLGKHHSPESIEKNRISNTGKKHSALSKINISNALKGKKHNLKKVICPHCQLQGNGPNMTRYHFDNCKSKNIKINN